MHIKNFTLYMHTYIYNKIDQDCSQIVKYYHNSVLLHGFPCSYNFDYKYLLYNYL